MKKSANEDQLITEVEGFDVDELEITQQVTKKKNNKNKKKKSTGSTPSSFSFHPIRNQYIKLENCAKKGRYLVAKSKLSAGTLFWCEKAICAVGHGTSSICSNCGKYVDPRSCHREEFLPLEVFCSTSCLNCLQANSFEYYKLLQENIPKIAAERDCDKDLLRMVFYLMNWELSHSSPADIEAYQSPQPYLTDSLVSNCTDSSDPIPSTIQATVFGLSALESHIDKQGAAWVSCVQSAVRDVVSLLSSDLTQQIATLVRTQKLLCDKTLLLPSNSPAKDDAPAVGMAYDIVCSHALYLASVVNVNAYGIIDCRSTGTSHESKAIGFGMFPAVGLCVNHDCCPNSSYSFSQEGEIEFRTLREVAPGEELTVSYIDLFQGTKDRRALIQDKRFFLCQCGRCQGSDIAMGYLQAVVNATAGSGTSGNATGNKKKANKGANASDNGALSFDDYFSTLHKASSKPPQSSQQQNTGTSGVSEQSVLSDLMTANLFCEQCGPAGVVVWHQSVASAVQSESSPEKGTSHAMCMLCNRQSDPAECLISLEYAATSWSTVSSTAQYMSMGSNVGGSGSSRQVTALIEKFLSETDPHFTATIPNSTTSASAVNVNIRRRKCPLQLHPNHKLLTEAYILLTEHYLHNVRSGSLSAGGTSTGASDLRNALSALRRVLSVLQSMLPANHPEISYLQLELCKALRTEIAHRKSSGGGGAANNKAIQELRKERKELLTKATQSRVITYGRLHALTAAAVNEDRNHPDM